MNSFYLYLQKRLLEHCDKDKYIELNQAQFRVQYMKIPKQLFWVFISEMQELGLIERVDRFKIKIINNNHKKLDNLNKLYKEVGLW